MRADSIALRPTLALLAALAAARCTAPVARDAGPGPSPDAAPADAPAALDARDPDAVVPDVVAPDSTPLDGSAPDAPDSRFAPGHPQCDPCIRARCADWPGALACLDDPACLAIVQCWLACSDMACSLACFARDPSRMAQVQALEGCATDRCDRACIAPVVVTDAAPVCQGLGAQCDPFVPAIATCCEGATCPASGDWYCCHPAGGACTAENHCCPPARCNRDAMRCEVPTCTPTAEDCRVFGGLACCDSRLVCPGGYDGGLAAPHCCAPNGAVLPSTDGALCCSLTASDNRDGTVTCVPRP